MAFLTSPRLRVASAIFSDLAVVWIVALLAAVDVVTLLRDVIIVIVLVILAIKSETLSEEL